MALLAQTEQRVCAALSREGSSLVEPSVPRPPPRAHGEREERLEKGPIPVTEMHPAHAMHGGSCIPLPFWNRLHL